MMTMMENRMTTRTVDYALLLRVSLGVMFLAAWTDERSWCSHRLEPWATLPRWVSNLCLADHLAAEAGGGLLLIFGVQVRWVALLATLPADPGCLGGALAVTACVFHPQWWRWRTPRLGCLQLVLAPAR